ncbi:MAG: ComEC/Rec2 family competence protein, partial [Bacteroidota bacterium]
TYIEESQYRVNRVFQKDIFYYSDGLRTKLLENLKKIHFSPIELNVLAALLLGQQQEINQAIIRDYQMAGAIHILSVSGLHVGFIVLFLNFILKQLPKKKWANLLKLTVTLLCLWGFALIAGLSPSVIRSVTMFSFVAIGLYLNRKTNMFHTLLVSLLIILLFEPSFLFDVGFQLSYVALFFILWLQPLISQFWTPKNKILSYFWDIVTVSFAAQIGTFPISIYYFHQFPGLFFLTNLIVIPFLSVIMASGLLLMTLSLLGLMPVSLVFFVEKSITTLNQFIHWIATFDEFVFTNIPLTNTMLLTYYLLIVSTVLYLSKPIFRRMLLFLISGVLLQVSYLHAKWETEHAQEWIVFNLSKSTLLVDRIGAKVTVYKDFSGTKNDPLQPYLVANFSEVIYEYTLPKLMFAQNKKIAILDSSRYYPKGENPDILLLR